MVLQCERPRCWALRYPQNRLKPALRQTPREAGAKAQFPQCVLPVAPVVSSAPGGTTACPPDTAAKGAELATLHGKDGLRLSLFCGLFFLVCSGLFPSRGQASACTRPGAGVATTSESVYLRV